MKKNKAKNFIYSVLVIFSFIFAIVLIRTDFFKKDFFWNTFSTDIELPSSYDIRNVNNYNYTSPPKNQAWAACWAFASTSALESNMLMHNQSLSYYLDNDNDGIYEDSSHVLDFSERQIDYFIASEDYYNEGYNPFTLYNHLIGRGGQMMYAEVAFATGLSPILQEKWAYPTEEVNVDIADVFDLNNVEYFVTEIDRLPEITSSATQEVKEARMRLIKEYIMQYGAVAFAGPKGSASNNCFDRDIRLYQYSPSCDVVGGHAMEFIGWDDNYGPDGIGAWLVRDGLTGENGNPDAAFYYMSYSFDAYFNMFIIKTVKERDWDNDYNLTKKNEYSLKTVSGTRVYQMKYYKDPNHDEKLRYINFIPDDINTSYNIYISTTGNTNDYTFYKTVTKELPGLYTIEVNDDIILNSDSFLIKIESSTSKISTYGNHMTVAIQAFTDDVDESVDRNVYVDYDIDNYVMSSLDTIRFNVYTENIDISETPSIISIYNDNDEEVSELFSVSTSAYYNDYGFIEVKSNGTIPVGNYTFRIGYSDVYMDVIVEGLSSIDHSVFSGGTGLSNDPYLVSTVEQLVTINTHSYYLQAHYELINDIDLSICKNEGSICYNNGKGWTPIGNDSHIFTGTFDGKNHKISNLYMKYLVDQIGLFGYIKDATIKNIIMENVDVSGNTYVGSVVGTAYKSNLINIKVSGTVNGKNYVGGVSGGYNPYIDNYIDNIANYSNVTGTTQVGGIVGRSTSYITISNSYNFGTISGAISGGLVGIVALVYNNTSIRNCFNTGEVSGNTAGGMIGNIQIYNYNINLENIYNIGEIYGSSYRGQMIGKIDNNYTLTMSGIYILDNDVTSIGNVGANSNGNEFTILTKEELLVEDNFIDFDFRDDWEIKNENAYPTLKNNPYVYITNIGIENDNIEIELGDDYQLDYIISPSNATNKKLNYTIMKEELEEQDDSGRGIRSSVVSISDEGLITTNALGTVTFAITAEDNSYPTKEINISVIPAKTHVESVEFVEEELTIEIEEELTLEYTINPNDADNKNVTFTSSDSNIVSVDENGKIVGITAGEAVITITTEDNNKSDSVSIIVKEKVVLSSETYIVKEDFTIAIPDLITKEMFNSNIYSSYRITCDTQTEYIGTGAIITIEQENLLTYSYQVIVYGDIDGDGIINNNDINSVVNYIYKNNSSLSGTFLKAADYNLDGKYTLSDIMKMAKKSLERE